MVYIQEWDQVNNSVTIRELFARFEIKFYTQDISVPSIYALTDRIIAVAFDLTPKYEFY